MAVVGGKTGMKGRKMGGGINLIIIILLIIKLMKYFISFLDKNDFFDNRFKVKQQKKLNSKDINYKNLLDENLLSIRDRSKSEPKKNRKSPGQMAFFKNKL